LFWNATTAGCAARDLLRSALENIVRNAVRYTPSGTTVEITLRKEEGTREGHSRKKRERGVFVPFAVIAVRDHGPGIATTELEQIFQPFYRSDSARDRQSGGAGLGLTIAARAVGLHGGAIAARNAPDGGLIVEIRLPLTS
jgi:two-component system sensor histidine kinase CpxA